MHRATEHFSCTDETAFQPKTHEASNPMVVSKYVDCAESEGQVTANVESGKTPPTYLQTVSHYSSTVPPNELLIYFARVTTNHYMRFEYRFDCHVQSARNGRNRAAPGCSWQLYIDHCPERRSIANASTRRWHRRPSVGFPNFRKKRRISPILMTRAGPPLAYSSAHNGAARDGEPFWRAVTTVITPAGGRLVMRTQRRGDVVIAVPGAGRASPARTRRDASGPAERRAVMASLGGEPRGGMIFRMAV